MMAKFLQSARQAPPPAKSGTSNAEEKKTIESEASDEMQTERSLAPAQAQIQVAMTPVADDVMMVDVGPETENAEHSVLLVATPTPSLGSPSSPKKPSSSSSSGSAVKSKTPKKPKPSSSVAPGAEIVSSSTSAASSTSTPNAFLSTVEIPVGAPASSSTQADVPMEESGTTEPKPEQTKQPLIPETKYVRYLPGKLSLAEVKISLRWIPLTIKELSEFHGFVEAASPQDWKDGLPVRFYPLIAKLVQDSSLTTSELVNELLEILFPLRFDHTLSLLPEEAALFSRPKPLSSYSISKVLPNIAKRENYGISEDVAQRMALWKWEVQDLSLFPVDLIPLIQVRRARRVEARQEVIMINEKLNEDKKSKEDKKTQEKEAKKKLEQDLKDEKERKRLELLAAKEKERVEREQKKAEDDRQRQQLALQKQLATTQKQAEETPKKTPVQITNFFTSKASATPEPADHHAKQESYFSRVFKDFPLKQSMTLAPRFRVPVPSRESIDAHLENLPEVPYLETVKGKKVVGRVVYLPVGKTKVPLKLLHFTDNYRPCYYGTWRKTSKAINPRKPLNKDESNLNYEVDSDEEWGDEDEGGESLGGSEGEQSEVESMAGDNSESEDDWLEKDDQEEEMNRRRKVKLEKLVPVTIGTFFQDPSDFSVSANPVLGQFRAESLSRCSMGIDVLTPVPVVADAAPASPLKSSTGREKVVPEEAIPKLVTGFSLKKTIRDFLTEFPAVSKRQLEMKIEELTTKKKLTEFSKSYCYVKDEYLHLVQTELAATILKEYLASKEIRVATDPATPGTPVTPSAVPVASSKTSSAAGSTPKSSQKRLVFDKIPSSAPSPKSLGIHVPEDSDELVPRGIPVIEILPEDS